MDTNDLVRIAKGTEQDVLMMRRWLHQNPETRWETEKTREFITEQIKQMGLKENTMDGGIVVNVHSRQAAETILCRADFDALPVEEKTGLPCASLVQGKSHACGHDVGTAMLLGALRVIARGEVKPTKSLRFVFQDAEENPGTSPRPESGGEVLVKDGVLKDVSRAYALHIDNMPEGMLGAFRSRPGAMLGNSGRIYFKIKCSGGHVAKPHTGINALRVINAVMNRLNTFIARHFAAIQPATLEPAVINGGKASNVMPAEAEMWYGFRTMLPRDEHVRMTEEILKEIRLTAACMGAEIAEERPIYGHPTLINDRDAHREMCDILCEAGQTVVEMAPLLGGEDFAHYLYKVPGAMFTLGAHTPGSGDHHSPTFNPDETVFWKGVLFWLLLATS